MRIAFWNVRRLGEGTEDARKASIKTVFEGIGADLTLFCELTTKSTYPLARNLTYRRENPLQLCYGAIDRNGADLAPAALTAFTPVATDEYKRAGYKGGNDFTQLADRAVGTLGNVGGVYVYVLHAPASGDAVKALSFLACDLNRRHGGTPWLVIGDFNVEPQDLAAAPVGIRLSDLILTPAEATYIGYDRDKTLDYVLCNFKANARIARVRASPRHHGSDHYPIVVEFP